MPRLCICWFSGRCSCDDPARRGEARQGAADRCGDPDPEISISACSGVIQSGRARGRDLAVAHTHRGVAYVALARLRSRPAGFRAGHRDRFEIFESVCEQRRGSWRPAGLRQGDRRLHTGAGARADSAPAFADRAGMYRLNGQYDEAIRDYGEAIKRDPAFTDAFLNRAITLAGTSRCADAIADFTRVIELNPGEAIAYVDRGVCHESAGRHDLAFERLLGASAARRAVVVRPRAAGRVVLPDRRSRSRARGFRAGCSS